MTWLQGFAVVAEGRPGGPAARGAAALAGLGSRVKHRPSLEESLYADGVRTVIPGWRGELEARAAAGLPAEPPHDLVACYLGLRAATAVLRRESVLTMESAAELAAGFGAGPEVEELRCSDGWLVARWRTPDEKELFAVACDWRRASVESAAATALGLRLLVAPVRPPSISARPLAVTAGATTAATRHPLRVVDWSSLWAGPWAAGALARDGAVVDRIEHPRRRDGYAGDSATYRRFNDGKRLHLVDAATPDGWARAAELLTAADVVISGHTLRVLPNFGFDDEWLARRGPRLLLELVAFEPPHEDAPGLGEQASAMAGLLWHSRQPFTALPWADPLLGAHALLAVRAWERAGRPAGARVRLSLEEAARLAIRETD